MVELTLPDPACTGRLKLIATTGNKPEPVKRDRVIYFIENGMTKKRKKTKKTLTIILVCVSILYRVIQIINELF